MRFTPLAGGRGGAVADNRIVLDFEPPLAWITLNRPEKLNALDRASLEALRNALDEVVASLEVAVVAITGAGEKAFCAGADVRELSGVSPDEVLETNLMGHAVFDAIEALRKPVLAVINGHALGGGLELALSCDIRIAADNARLGLPEVKLGVIPGWGGTYRLPAVVGAGRAREMILTGRLVDSSEALGMGLVSQVVSASRLREATLDVSRELATKSPGALALAKGTLRAGGPVGERLSRVESGSVASLVAGDEFRRRLDRFLGGG